MISKAYLFYQVSISLNTKYSSLKRPNILLIASNIKDNTDLLHRTGCFVCSFSPIQQQTYVPGLLGRYCLDKESSSCARHRIAGLFMKHISHFMYRWETLSSPSPSQKLFNKMVRKFSPDKLKSWKFFRALEEYSISRN